MIKDEAIIGGGVLALLGGVFFLALFWGAAMSDVPLTASETYASLAFLFIGVAFAVCGLGLLIGGFALSVWRLLRLGRR